MVANFGPLSCSVTRKFLTILASVLLFSNALTARKLDSSIQADDPTYAYFEAVAGQDVKIDAQELQQSLTKSGISGNYQPFSLETCRIMINMLDRDYSGKMGFNEFKELWVALNQWKTMFVKYDKDKSGTMDLTELNAAVLDSGYRLSPQALNVIIKRYAINSKIPFDNFVGCLVRLRGLTDQFRRRDTTQLGKATFEYDDFIQVTMYW